jgi:hypothetical protein
MHLRGIDKDNFYIIATIRSWSSIIAVVTRLQAGTTNEFSSPARGLRFFALSEWPYRLWDPISLLLNKDPAAYNCTVIAFQCRG